MKPRLARLSITPAIKTRVVAWGVAAVGLASLAGTLRAQPVEAPPKAAATEPTASEQSANHPPEIGTQWVRVANDAQGEPLAMQVAIVRYRGAADGRPVVVDLVGAVHMGDAQYYQQLNKRFESYDALLYELVAPEGTVIRPEDVKNSDNVFHSTQNAVRSMLELEHQLEGIDYSRPNFVHADMSPEQFVENMQSRFLKSMTDEDEQPLAKYFRTLGRIINFQSKQADSEIRTNLNILQAMYLPDRARRLRVVFAEQLADNMEAAMIGMGGESGSTLITERNKAALAVLKAELAAGKSKLGIFYGAGHLTDMDKRLRKEFSLQPEEITWLNAWDLAK